jgi:hypothetical protein
VHTAPHLFVLMDTTDITPMIARRTAIMAQTTLSAACSSGQGRGITAGTDADITGAAIMGVRGTATDDRDTATGAATVAGRGTEIAQGTRIEALPAAAMAEAGSAATSAAVSAAVLAPAAAAAFTATVEADSMVAEAPTVVAATEAGTGKSN